VKLSAHNVYNDDGSYLATIAPASKKAVAMVAAQSEKDPDGRSQFVWVRLANGDLVLGVYPQGDTYCRCEKEAP